MEPFVSSIPDMQKRSCEARRWEHPKLYPGLTIQSRPCFGLVEEKSMKLFFILYSVQHMSYLYHKHQIFNIFVYNSMSTFSLRSCALKICSPIMSLFLLFLFKFSLQNKTHHVSFLSHFSPIWIGWEDFFVVKLPQNWFQKTLWLFSTTFLSPTAPFSKSLSSSRFHFHLWHLCFKVSPRLLFHQKRV